jgi:hypothetical protein
MSTAKSHRDLHWAMDGIVAPDESAHKSNHNRRRLNVLTVGLRCPGFIRTEILLDGICVVSCRQSRHRQYCRRTTRCCWPCGGENIATVNAAAHQARANRPKHADNRYREEIDSSQPMQNHPVRRDDLRVKPVASHIAT